MEKLRLSNEMGGAHGKHSALSRDRVLGFGILAAVAWAILSPALIAAPDAGDNSGGPTDTFTGDQHQGISSGVDFNSPPVFTINVNNLSSTIAPTSGVSGISFSNGSAGNLTINTGTTGSPITISTANATGITIQSIGNPPSPTNDPFLGIPIPGSAAASGGQVTVNSFSNITTTGNLSYGIYGRSATSGYPQSVIDALNGFTGTGISFKMSTTGTLSATQVTLSSGTNSGSITPIGAGDKIVLNSNGTYTFLPGTTFAGLATSGTMFISVPVQVSGTNTTNSGTDLESGTLVLSIVKTGSNTFTTSTVGSYFATFGPSSTAFPDLQTYVNDLKSLASAGGAGNSVTVTNSGTIHTSGTSAHGIYVTSQGGNGPNGSDASILHSSTRGGNGSTGGAVSVTANGSITTLETNAAGVLALSLGGNGGKGGDSGYTRNAKAGGGGGAGGEVDVSGTGTINTSGTQAVGILAVSQGGNGGGGGAGSTFNSADDGGPGGQGGSVTVSGSWSITTSGSAAHGIWAKAVGGVAGGGGDGGWTGTSSGAGGQGTTGGTVIVVSNGHVTTHGVNAFGIYAESIGGFGGNGGDGTSIFYAAGGSGASAGSGGSVSVTTGTGSVITTTGSYGHGIFAQSVGGGGGSGGGGGGLVAVGGSGSTGGNGGDVTVVNSGSISVSGSQSRGIYAQSVGGGGGDGGDVGGLAAIGGAGSTTSAGGTVKLSNNGNVNSTSNGVFAQSVGGGGGNGGSSVGWFSIGGNGGSGGDGGTVALTNNGNVSTTEANASAIFAQSLGGGGGNGGNSVAVGAYVSVAIGGKGAQGGNGQKATVGVSTTDGSTIIPASGTITTQGDNSHGIQVQSIGGGGGNGGFAVSAAAGSGGAVSIGIGGGGGAGGNSGEVDAYYNGPLIQTSGKNSNGIFAQSVGGGGGSGGFSIAVSFSAGGPSGAFSMGGSGGAGGNAGIVNVGNLSNPIGGDIITTGEHSYGIEAQSVGGGGGNGGFSIAGTVTLSNGLALSFGGSGGVAGTGTNVTLYSNSAISTSGLDSHGIVAQSIGGGGGAGGASVSGNLSAGIPIGISFGGSGGGGGSAGNVTLVSTGTLISTGSDRSDGILAQSVGGGGGNGGMSVAGSVTLSPALDFSMGGAGGTASNAGTVTLSTGTASGIITLGNDSHGIVAQSVGGGGGSGGFSVAAGISISPSGGAGSAISASIGGQGGAGGNSSDVFVTSSGTAISTSGTHSYGILAQSVGGGGGDGGFSVAGGISDGPTVSFSMGGNGATGGNAGNVQVLNNSMIITHGDNSHALFAQSIGGGGGSGGFSVTGNLTTTGGAVGVSLGGTGAGGGNAGNVAVGAIITGTSGGLPPFTGSPVTGGIMTTGNHSDGILAQSIGGSGGDGGFSVAGSITTGPVGGSNVNFSMGGGGGSGGQTGDVVVDSASAIGTTGTNSHGILAQSIGGGGGNGGFSVAGAITSGAGVGVSIGGNGSAGADAKTVQVISTGTMISTQQGQSDGILAQSVGGGGGSGGFSVAGNISQSASLGFSMGGSGDGGGAGDTVTVSTSSIIITHGDDSRGIFAQSLGGGGGDGGFSVAGGISSNSSSIDASIGGKAGGGGSAGTVTVGSSGIVISTGGNDSSAILAQSIGGGGGAGGFSVAGGLSNSTNVNFSLGGNGGVGGDGNAVVVSSTSSLMTTGTGSHGIFAQSVGGGGGSGGFSVAGGISSGSNSSALSASIGGSGTSGGSASTVNVTSSGSNIITEGDHSDGILAQSVGGGGGDGGFSVAGDISKGKSVSVSIGGSGGIGGSGTNVFVINSSDVTTLGSVSNGILAQSVGGGGGSGGFSIAGSISSGSDGGGLAFSMGGKGANGGAAGMVNVSNTGNIYTGGTNALGNSSDGILAQSIGGGGGNGGFSGAITGGFGNSKNLAFSIGGSAGGGNNANTVTVNSSGTIATTGTGSVGVFAQSVGGGGGNGGFSLAAVLNTGTSASTNLSVSLGGNGGTGGDGGVVVIGGTYNGGSGTGAFTASPLTGAVLTSGSSADAILAQSIGGGGGNGGFSAAGTLSSSGTGSKQVSVSIGGSGGSAGDGNTVYVNTGANLIMTGSDSSVGILAQSIGGGGGNGGMSFTGAFEKSAGTNLSVSIGGNGAGGGNGGEVDVISNNPIFTQGNDSFGVLAQSIGGGGGVGGFSGSVDIGTGGNADTTTMNLGVSIGGSGAGGGTGGNVNVHTSGGITTIGDESAAIYAQSVGGGGGDGGGSLQGTVSLKSQSPGTIYNMSVAVGGGGGSGNIGGNVLVGNNGDLHTTGDGSDGILAQSVGGGGGEGGSARTFTLDLPGGGQKDEDGKPIDGAKQNKSLSLAIGGNGGIGNNGGTVTISNTGAITTQGDESYGIAAESIGGGGGIGGRGIQGTGLPIPGLDKVKFFKNLQISVGGNGAGSGNGELVNVTQSGNITTSGSGSFGILAQSIGGGGGIGGAGDIGFTGKIGIGGAGGAAGDGGEVDVTVLSGTIFTTGTGASGIMAQSIGGGGGIAGNVTRGLAAYANIGIGLGFGRDGGGGGNGGAVTISSTNTIITVGDGASGIFAQSVGGGGGVVGAMGNDAPLLSYLNFAGSVGASGSGGIVNVTQTGTIATFGEASHGIFAQSAGGTGTGGDVIVTLNGSIFASGTDSNGIFAQSIGQGGMGNISVTINGGSVEGGTWSGTDGSTPAGVRIADGKDNTLNNSGSIFSADGLTGFAVISGSGNDTVNNNFAITDSVDLGSGTNAFYNKQGAILQSGSVIILGAGNYFYDSGTISPGSIGTLETTNLTGNFTQTGSSNWIFDVTPAITSDLFAISGTASLTGINAVNLNEIGVPATTGTYTLITAPLGLTGTFQFDTLYGGTMPVGLTYHLVNSDTKEQLALVVSTGSFYWRGAVDGVWNSPFVSGQSNWTSDQPGNDFIYGSPGSLVDVFFSSTNPATANINTALGADFSINSLTITDTNSVSIGGTNSLTLVAANGTGVTVGSGAGPAVLSSYLVLGGDQSWINDSMLYVADATVTGAKNLTVQGSGTTNITSIIATGTGALFKEGTGTLVLYAPNTYSGGTVLRQGNLVLTNTNALGTGNVRLSGGTLFTTNDPSVPATTPLHESIGGAYTQSGTSVLRLRIIGPTGVNDRLEVAGAVNLGGVFVPDYSVTGYNPIPPAGNYTDAFEVIHSDTGVYGQFTTYADPHYDSNKLLRWEPVYNPNDVMLEWDQHPFSIQSLLPAGIILTGNQTSVANVLNTEMGLGSGQPKPYNESTGPALDAHPGLRAAINFLNNEPLKNLPGDYDLISPDELTSIFTVGTALAEAQGNNIENRLAELRSGGGSGFSATGFNLDNDHGSISIATLAFVSPMGTGDDLSPVAERTLSGDGKTATRYKTDMQPESEYDPRWGMFITGGGEFAHVGGDLNSSSYNFTTGGVTIGADYRMNEHFVVGIMGGYANTTTKLQNAGNIEINSGKLGVYSTIYGSGFYLNTLADGGYNAYDTRRLGLGGMAWGNTAGAEFDGLISGGYDAHFGNLTVGPIASLRYTYVDINKFSETGSLLPLTISRQNQDSLLSKLGLRFSYDWKTANGMVVTPMLSAAWQHEYLNSAFALDSNFAQGAGNIFSVQGPVIGRDSAIIDVGINFQWTARFGTYLNYDGEFGRKNYQNSTISGGMRLNF